MLERTLSCVVAVAALAVGAAISAQPARYEDELAAAERETARQYAESAREYAEAQRAAAREISRVQSMVAVDSEEIKRELAKAREQLSASAAEIARLSAQMTQPALRDVMSRVRYIAGGQAMLGLNIQDTDLGVLVGGVTPSGPAATAGVAVGDTIVAINGVELARPAGSPKGRPPSAAFVGELANAVPGDEVELRVLRDGDYRDVVVQAESRGFPYVFGPERLPQPAAMLRAFREPWLWRDAELVSVTPGLAEYFGVDEGLLVVRAGRMADVGLRDGDVILEIGGRAPQTPEHAMRILGSFEPGESVQVSIMRQRRRAALTVDIPAAADSWIGSER